TRWGTASDHRGAQGRFVERKIAQDELDLAGVDPFLLKLGKDIVRETRAVRTCQRSVFDDCDRGGGVAENPVVLADPQQPLSIGNYGLRPCHSLASCRHKEKANDTRKNKPDFPNQ